MLSIKILHPNAKLHIAPTISATANHPTINPLALLFQFAIIAKQLHVTMLFACSMTMVNQLAITILNLAMMETNAPLTNAKASLEIAFTLSSKLVNANLAYFLLIALNGLLHKNSTQTAMSLSAAVSDTARFKLQAILPNALLPPLAPKIPIAVLLQPITILQINASLHTASVAYAKPNQSTT